ncbi:hypothetical protein E2P71_09320 [Candidatus Bathyarchaeota archaeon]|nr:hypothetical protein E2P71_09320 [Candidatus Bathyarchaeota archaeon]
MNNIHQDLESSIKLTKIQLISLKLMGITPTSKRKLPGWRGELQFYAFNCPTHGVVEDYPHGYGQTLRCSKCLKKDMDH